jgi:hypothetical protein
MSVWLLITVIIFLCLFEHFAVTLNFYFLNYSTFS